MKKRVFLSGVTGTMGNAALAHLTLNEDKLDIVTIVRPSSINKNIMKQYKGHNVEIIWGDLTIYKDVKKALENVDYILHVAALVSPEADYEPEKAWEINVGSTENILRAIDELKLYDVKLVYIGSVAETGDRLPPIHWGRVGDPLKPSIYDNYAVTKIAPERKVIESGLKYWVSLRQTGILHYGLPDEFWKNIYNIGGGESFRKTNYEFMSMILEAVDVNDIEKIFETNWFARRNFHGQYYLDSDILNDYLDFRRETMEDFINRFKKKVKFPALILKYLPDIIIKNLVMKAIAKSKSGTLAWIKSKDEGRIKAFFGYLEEGDNIKTWGNFSRNDNLEKKLILDHGYDEEKEEKLLSLEDMKKAANFRGGACLSLSMKQGDLDTKLKWICAFSHEFLASPRLVLKAGHWCEKCQAPPWNYDNIAKKNPFFKQVWTESNK